MPGFQKIPRVEEHRAPRVTYGDHAAENILVNFRASFVFRAVDAYFLKTNLFDVFFLFQQIAEAVGLGGSALRGGGNTVIAAQDRHGEFDIIVQHQIGIEMFFAIQFAQKMRFQRTGKGAFTAVFQLFALHFLPGDLVHDDFGAPRFFVVEPYPFGAQFPIFLARRNFPIAGSEGTQYFFILVRYHRFPFLSAISKIAALYGSRAVTASTLSVSSAPTPQSRSG